MPAKVTMLAIACLDWPHKGDLSFDFCVPYLSLVSASAAQPLGFRSSRYVFPSSATMSNNKAVFHWVACSFCCAPKTVLKFTAGPESADLSGPKQNNARDMLD